MRRPLAALPLLALLAACSGGSKAREDAALLERVQRGLAERDGKLQSYRLAGESHAGEARARFAFAYRAPGRMRAEVQLGEARRTFAWDGTRLYEQSDADKRFTTFESQLPPAKRAAFLTETFGPFSPEGFRAPLLTRTGLSARPASHPRAKDAVEVSSRASDGTEVRYTLRAPAMDFLAKRVQAPGGPLIELRVEDETCDAALGLCVPRRLTRWEDGQQVEDVRLTEVTLNPPLPEEGFTLAAPAGYAVASRTLVDAPAP